MQTARRAGFSLIEALVVLAIGGMALAVIFSIGIKAGDTLSLPQNSAPGQRHDR